MKLSRLAVTARAVALLLAGAVLVPLGIAVVVGIRAANSTDEVEALQRPAEMMAIYKITAPPVMILSSMVFDLPIEQCDIEPQKIFEKSRELVAESVRSGAKRPFNPYTGYFMLTMWRSANWNIAVMERQRQFVVRSFSPFAQGFLTGCMRYTLFRSQCADQIRSKFEASGWQDPVNASSLPNSEFRPDNSFEDKVMYTYLEGVAAKEQGPGPK